VTDFDLIPARASRLRRVLGALGIVKPSYWMTYRIPGRRAVVTYPDATVHPERSPVLAHERVHVAQFAPSWGRWVFIPLAVLLPLPVLFSGRWFIERAAYLQDIKRGFFTPETAADVLWRGYAWPWPKPLMVAWFKKRLRTEPQGVDQ